MNVFTAVGAHRCDIHPVFHPTGEGMLWNCKVSRGAWEETEYQRLVLLPAPREGGRFHVRHAFRIAALTSARHNEYRWGWLEKKSSA